MCITVVLRCVCAIASTRVRALRCGILRNVKVIGVCGRKGGSGKTTIAVNLAAEIASRGWSVTVVDADTQASATHWAALELLPMKVQPMPVSRKQDVDALARAVRQLTSEIVVLDSPPHLNEALGAVIGLSDVALLPCAPSGLDVIATLQTRDLIREIRTQRGEGRPTICMVPNKVSPNTLRSRRLHDELAAMGEDVSPPVHSRTAFANSFDEGQWIGDYEPNSTAYMEIAALGAHVLRLCGEKLRRKKA